jgi:hypothetical protein
MDPHSSADSRDVHHETSDVDIRAVLGFGLGLLLAGIVIHILIWLLFTFFSERQASHVAPEFPLAAGQENRLPPEPRLQTTPRQDLRDFRAQEDAILESYGWVDKNAGIVRIPIERAMQLTVEQGLPARPASDRTRSPRGQTK